MTEQECLLLFLKQQYPIKQEYKQKSWEDTLKDYGVKGALDRLRKKNAGENIGELNGQFIEWILRQEIVYSEKIKQRFTDSVMGLKIGNKKIKFTYYGMVFTILTWEGCYLRGKSKCNAPNRISIQKFCGDKLLNLNGKFKSDNVRKTIVNPESMYIYNYYLCIASEETGEKSNLIPDYARILCPIFKELRNEVRNNFFRKSK